MAETRQIEPDLVGIQSTQQDIFLHHILMEGLQVQIIICFHLFMELRLILYHLSYKQ